MLNGEGSVNGIKINGSKYKKKKTNLHVQNALLCISLPLFCTTTMYGGIVVCAYQKFWFLCSCSLLFFHFRSFSLIFLLAARISHFPTAVMKFSCVFFVFSFVFNHSL